MRDVFRESMNWLKVAYLAALVASWAFALRLGAWRCNEAAARAEKTHR